MSGYLTQDQMRLAAREAQRLNAHMLSTQARLRLRMVTESRGSATATVNGLGEVQHLALDGVDEEQVEHLIAALRACEDTVRRGFEGFTRGGRG